MHLLRPPSWDHPPIIEAEDVQHEKHQLFRRCGSVLTSVALADQAVQIDVKSVLNNRTVITCDASGKAIPWQWGVNGDAKVSYNGWATNHGAACAGTTPPIRGLPNDGKYPADAYHPDVVLNWSDSDPTGKQTRHSVGPDTFSFNVPPGKYSRLLLIDTNNPGSQKIHVDLTYDSGTGSKDLDAPGYYYPTPAANTPSQFRIGDNLDKWDQGMKRTEQGGHYIWGIDAAPSADKVLQKVTITSSGTGVLTFYGATAYGIPTGIPPAGSDAGIDGPASSDGATSGTGGIAGGAGGAGSSSRGGAGGSSSTSPSSSASGGNSGSLGGSGSSSNAGGAGGKSSGRGRELAVPAHQRRRGISSTSLSAGGSTGNSANIGTSGGCSITKSHARHALRLAGHRRSRSSMPSRSSTTPAAQTCVIARHAAAVLGHERRSSGRD